MINEYSEILEITKTELLKLQFELKKNSDYAAEFSNNSLWQIILEGDMFIHPAFDIFIIKNRNTSQEKRFAIRLLMRALGENRLPSLHNQLEFLINKHETLMTATDIPYEPAYRAISERY